ncbi:MAG: helix-turn-helix domain-containing protein, partial [Aliifodinibius sp.]|nr:helix-turn-helix transcriptional regulator [candidate division Zixibacteria bacterium]NIT60181.1 helix-turn-helix transcriptional regulator [Fodinibius sp.]NIW42539.1 helix-turn-helix domain-containing protein [candidate division Zixibacteria bacterium]NIX58378.1 helix-turn-helix domain-containing protein [candidate division Zixibacteria bacterium]NIY28763.1 helix-turn-helix domain-containing protein [Fodinibius sp.]
MEEANEKLSRFLLEAQMRISRERGGKRVSQSEMARIAGIPQGSYSKYETGSSPPG